MIGFEKKDNLQLELNIILELGYQMKAHILRFKIQKRLSKPDLKFRTQVDGDDVFKRLIQLLHEVDLFQILSVINNCVLVLILSVF